MKTSFVPVSKGTVDTGPISPPTARSTEFWGLSSGNDSKLVYEVEVAGRPSNMVYAMTNQSSWWTVYALMDVYRSEVSLMDTIISRSVTEIFRYGIDWEPAFVRKCVDCGNEYQNNVRVCPYCNSTRLVRPEEKQKDYFVRPDGTSFMDEVNDNGQTLKDLCRMYADSQYQNNEGAIVAVTGDVVDTASGRLERSYPLEFICIDAKYFRSLFDDTAKPGEIYGFIMEDRSNPIFLDKSPEALNDRTPEGKTIYPAYWKVGSAPGATGDILYYTKDEIYENHWFKQSMTYGVPIWMSIEDDLLTYHYIEKHNLKKYKYGYVRKILVFPGFSDTVMEKVAKGVQDVLAKNDNSIPIVGLPPSPPGTSGELRAQTLELGTESSSDLIQIKNDIRDRVCAQLGVPNLFVGDVVGSGGLNNESQQITTFDRYLMDKYDLTDDLLDWVLSWFPKITDWKLRVKRPSKADQENKRLLEQIQVAQGFKNLGFAVNYSNGEFTYSEKPVNDGSANVNTQMTQNGVPMDSEQADTDSEVGAYMDEAEEQYMASEEPIRTRALREWIGKGVDTPFRAGSFGYLKGTTEEQWSHYLAKDIYGFLRNNKEDIAEVLTVGYDVSFFFKTCTREQAKEIYIRIIEVLQEPQWSLKQVKDAVRASNPEFAQADPNDETINYYVERIARTEMNRILFYAKEQMAMQDGELDKLYVWQGPLDARTTPMCRFLQTGQLTGQDRNGEPYDYEYLRASLPEWEEGGWPLDVLKDVCRQVHDVFYENGLINTPMASDWQMHINCRHTFRAKSVIPRDSKWSPPQEMGGYLQVQDAEPTEAEVPAEAPRPGIPGWEEIRVEEPALTLQLEGAQMLADTTGETEVYIDEVPEARLTFGFTRSVNGGIPSYYLSPDEDTDDEPVFVFRSVDEVGLADWLRFASQEAQAGMSEYNIIWAMKDESPLSDEEIYYAVDNRDWLYRVAIGRGWLM